MAAHVGLASSSRTIGERVPASAVLSAPISVVTEAALLGTLDDVVTARRPTVFVGLYAALFRVLAHDASYRRLVHASVNYPDGNGLVSELRRRGVASAERLATTDVVHPITRLAADRGWRVGLYGAAPGVAERAAENLRAGVPGLQIVRVWDGYGDGPSAADLRAARLDVLFVAIGAPRQEAWAYDVAVPAGVPAILTCGGLLDFLSGDRRRAPRWMQRASLEWAFRVMLEPRRLLSRYLKGNGYFLWHARQERRRNARTEAELKQLLAGRGVWADPIAR
jgi:N-acetylglucosaminyldiphosphoundecaprenol N-acetyl-beta-D-mannosaminyltransferase